MRVLKNAFAVLLKILDIVLIVSLITARCIRKILLNFVTAY